MYDKGGTGVRGLPGVASVTSGNAVTPRDDDPCMSTQLRLVEASEPKGSRRARPRARVTRAPKARRVHWATDWRLDETTRSTGRRGVAAAREALAAARRPETDLPRAS